MLRVLLPRKRMALMCSAHEVTSHALTVPSGHFASKKILHSYCKNLLTRIVVCVILVGRKEGSRYGLHLQGEPLLRAVS